MPDGQNTHAVGMDAVEDRVWKPLQVSLASSSGGQWEGLWILGDLFQHSVDLVKKFVAKVVLALIIPGASIVHFALNSDVVGQLHELRRFEKWPMNVSWLISRDGSPSTSASR